MWESEIAHRIHQRNYLPVTLQLNPTNRCNLTCVYCWLRDHDRNPRYYAEQKNQEVPIKRYIELIDEAKELKIREVTITGGGEPYLRNGIERVMNAIKEQSLFGVLITNGTLQTQKNLEKWVQIGWNKVIFSLDAPDSQANNALRGRDAFQRTVKTLLRLKKINREKTINTNIHVVLTNRNSDTLPEMIELANTCEISSVFFQPVVQLLKTSMTGYKLKKTQQDRVQISIDQAHSLSRKYGIESNLHELSRELRTETNNMHQVIEKDTAAHKGAAAWPCYQPWHNIVIRPNGIVGPCCMFDNTGQNINDHSLRNIWHHNSLEQVRTSLKKGKLQGYCKKCNPGQVMYNRRLRTILTPLSDSPVLSVPKS